MAATAELKGPPLREDTIAYMRRIPQALDDAAGDDEQRELLLASVHKELHGHEYRLAVRYDCSPILERVLAVSTASQLRAFLSNVHGVLHLLCMDRNASHVVQVLLRRLSADSLETFVAELEPHLLRLTTDSFGSHVLRDIISQAAVPKVEAADTEQRKAARAACKKLVAVLEAASDTQFHALVFDSHGGPVLQALLRALRPRTVQGLVARLLPRVPQLLRDRSGSHMFEALLDVLPEEEAHKILEQHFLGHLESLASHASGNYCLQTMLDHCKSKELLEKVYMELRGNFARFLGVDTNRSGVILHLVQACGRLAVRRSEMVEVCVGFAGSRGKLLDALLKRMARDESRMSAVGSLILQALLKFPVKQVRFLHDSFETLPAVQIAQLATDPAGSRAVEAFLFSEAPPIAKRRFIDSLVAVAVDLACNRTGSFVVERAFYACDLVQKQKLVSALAAAETRIMGFNSGRILLQNLMVGLFKSNRELWRARLLGLRNADVAPVGQDGLAGKRESSDADGEDGGIDEDREEERHKALERAQDEASGDGGSGRSQSPLRKRRKREERP